MEALINLLIVLLGFALAFGVMGLLFWLIGGPSCSDYGDIGGL